MDWGIWCWETCCKVIDRSLFWGCLLHTVNAVCLWTNRVSLTRLFLKTKFFRLWAIPGVDSHFCTLRRRTKSVTFFTNIQSQCFHLLGDKGLTRWARRLISFLLVTFLYKSIVCYSVMISLTRLIRKPGGYSCSLWNHTWSSVLK